MALDRLELTILTGEWIGTAACDVNDAFARLEKEGELIQVNENNTLDFLNRTLVSENHPCPID